MTTLKQALSILLRTSSPPLSTHFLGALFNQKPISLLKVVRAVNEQTVLQFLEIRPVTILDGTSTVAQFVSKWASEKATQDTITLAYNTLKPLGVFVAYVSKDLQTIGIRATNSSLLRVQALRLIDPSATPANQNQAGLANGAQGLLGLGAGIGFLLAAPAGGGIEAAFFIAAGFFSFAAAGLFIALTLVELGFLTAQLPPVEPIPGDLIQLANQIIYSLPDELSVADATALLGILIDSSS